MMKNTGGDETFSCGQAHEFSLWFRHKPRSAKKQQNTKRSQAKWVDQDFSNGGRVTERINNQGGIGQQVNNKQFMEGENTKSGAALGEKRDDFCICRTKKERGGRRAGRSFWALRRFKMRGRG